MAAYDQPHTPDNTIECGNCHFTSGTSAPSWMTPGAGDNTVNNQRCTQCHISSATHSTSSTGSTKWQAEGGWMLECVSCHNPHYQMQSKRWGVESYIVTGTVASVGAYNAGSKETPITFTAPLGAEYQGYYLIPNTVYRNFVYKIKTVTNGQATITVKGKIGTGTVFPKAGAGTQFAIVYSKNVKDSISYMNPGGTAVGSTTVKMFRPSGDRGPGDTAPAGYLDESVCYVCHTLASPPPAIAEHQATSAACASCHAHDEGFKGGGCDTCHGNPPGVSGGTLITTNKDGGPVTSDSFGVGAHAKHFNAGYTCTNCHTGGMTSASTGDNFINIGFSLSGNLGGSYDGKSGRAVFPYAAGGTTSVSAAGSYNCSSLYCHSTGQGDTANNATPTYASPSPSWNTPASGACGTCHKVTAASGLTSGSHAQHLSSAVSIGCNDCHTGAAADGSSYSSANHVNKLIDAANSYTAGGAPGNGYGQCNNQACHGGDGTSAKSPVWGNPTAKAGCYRCHGDSANGNAAPGPDNMGDTAATDPQVGAHQTHLKGSNNYSAVIACNECHTVPANVQAPGHIKDGTPGVAEVPLAGILANTNPRSVAGSPGYASSQCSNVYCHDSSRFQHGSADGWTGGSGHTPSWADTAYLGADKAVNCGRCHGNPPAGGHPAATANVCNGCHSNVLAAGDGFVDKSLHVNGILEPAAGCTGCHEANGTTLPGKHGVHYNTATDAGSHSTATNNSTAGAYIFQCGNCHNDETNHMGATSFAAISFNVSWAPVTTGTYTANTGNGNDSTDSRGLPISTDGSCSNLYCHSNANPTGGANSYSTIAWNGTVNCGSCHKTADTAANMQAAGTPSPMSAAHVEHVATDRYGANANFRCSTCHSATASNNTTISDKSRHVNGTKTGDVVLGAFAGGSYAAGSCNNVYCHSTGEATPTYKPVAWSSTITTCDACHNYDAAATNKMSTGNHTEHMNNASVIGTNYGCQECHNSTTTDGTTITTVANHVNKTRDVSMVKGGSWTSPNCTSTYCHSTGQATPTYVNPPAWGSATDLTCDGCHGTEGGTAFGEPAYANGAQPAVVENNDNSHIAHVTVAADCARCHTDTVDVTGTTIKTGSTLHTNQTRNVNFAAAYDTNGGTNSDNYNTGTKTCSAISCHGAGTPQWGGASLACNQCHLANNTLAGKHSRHYGVATVATTADKTPSNTSSTTVYEYSCGVCHNGTPHADGNVSANQAAQVVFDGTIAVGGTYTPGALAGTDTGGFEWTNGTCSSTYCHSQGQSTTSPFGGAPNTAATWNGAAMNCESCHNFNAAATNKMASGKHTQHINDGTIMPNVACSACHVSTTSDSTTITNESLHVNKTRDVTIAGTYDSDATPGNNWDGTQCSNVYCHSDGKATPTYVPVAWNSTISTCTACHGGAGTTTTLTASHLAHIGTDATDTRKQFGYTCDDCHSQTASSNSAIGTPANHVNKARDVSVAAANGGTGTIGGDFSGGTCSTTNCHGTASPDWTAGATNGDCSACHGMAASATDDRDTSQTANNNTDLQIGAHEAHLNATHSYSSPIACGECHKTTVDNMAAQATYVLKVNAVGHIDTALPAEAIFGTLASFNPRPVAGSPGYAQPTCSNMYCHDYQRMTKGYGDDASAPAATRTPSWNVPLLAGTVADCQVCHGYPPALPHVQNSHCVGCHNHVNATNNGFKAAGDPSGGLTKHVNGIVDGGGDNCADCHSNATLSARHTVHSNPDTFLSGKTVSGGDYGKSPWWYSTIYESGSPKYACGYCHPQSNAAHMDTNINVNLSPSDTGAAGTLKAKNSASWSYSSGQCSGVYCHSNGYGSYTYATTPAWNGGTFAADKCQSCHGNYPNDTGQIAGSPAHTSHAVGIHYDTLYNLQTGGLMATGTGNNNSHGNSAYSTTINCNICHQNTVTVSVNRYSSKCNSCHNAGANAVAMTISTSSTSHVNGTPDVALVSLSGTMRSKAQIRGAAAPTPWTRNTGYKVPGAFDSSTVAPANYSGGSCTTSCHLNQPVQWTDTTVSCSSCHTTLP